MANAVVSLGSTSVTVPIREEGGQPIVARDIQKPKLRDHNVGEEDPESRDDLSAEDVFTVWGVLSGASAYADAKTLAEDIIKPRPDANTKQLDLSDLDSKSTYQVAEVSEAAVRLEYPEGLRQTVFVRLQLAVVESTAGGTQTGATTQTPAAGSGVKIDRGGTSVTLTENLRVVRTVGRQTKLLETRTDNQKHYDLNRPAVDVFEISGALTGASAESDANTLEEDIIRKRLGTDTITLHFQSSLYGLDAYSVVPTATQSLRTVLVAGEEGMVRVPTLKLRVVQ